MDSIDRLAQKLADMYRENRNPPSTAPRVGTVVSVEPLKIQYGDHIILESRHLIIAEHVMNGYRRELELTGVQVTGVASDGGSIDFHLSGSPPSQSYTITHFSLPQAEANRVAATMTYTDSLQVGDKVIIVPDSDLKLWYVLDRVWQGGDG